MGEECGRAMLEVAVAAEEKEDEEDDDAEEREEPGDWDLLDKEKGPGWPEGLLSSASSGSCPSNGSDSLLPSDSLQLRVFLVTISSSVPSPLSPW